MNSVGGRCGIKLCILKEYNVMLWHMYVLWSEYLCLPKIHIEGGGTRRWSLWEMIRSQGSGLMICVKTLVKEVLES
jgi:hypothetical protein